MDQQTEYVVLPLEEIKKIMLDCIKNTLREELGNFSQASEIMREKEAAEYLGVNPNTLRQYRTRKTGPTFCKAGSVVYYRKKDLDSYLDQAKIKTDN